MVQNTLLITVGILHALPLNSSRLCKQKRNGILDKRGFVMTDYKLVVVAGKLYVCVRARLNSNSSYTVKVIDDTRIVITARIKR